MPKPGTDLHQIVELKRKRNDELLQFRSSMDGLEDKLAKSQDKEKVRHSLFRFAEKQQMEVSNLSAALSGRENRSFGSVKVPVKSNSPAFWSSLLAIGGQVAGTPIISIGDYCRGCDGLLWVSTCFMDRRAKARQARQSSIAYPHYAKAEGLV